MEDRHAELRTAIVRIACDILEREGLEGLQARRLAREAGCSIGTLYNVFGNLDRIVIAANVCGLERLERMLAQALGEAKVASGPAALQALALAYLDFARDHPRTWRAIFEHRLTSDETVPQSYRDKQDELFATVERTLEPAVPSADVRRKASRALFGAVHGIVALALDEKLGTFEEDQTRWQVAFVVDAVARAMEQRL